MGIGNSNKKLVKSVAELKNTNYSRNPELNDMYQRLSSGRKQFAEVLEKNIKELIHILSHFLGHCDCLIRKITNRRQFSLGR